MSSSWCSIVVLSLSMQVCLATDSQPFFQTLCDGAEKCADSKLGEKLRQVFFLPTTEQELNSFCPSIVRVLWCVVTECAGKWSLRETRSNERAPEYKQYPYRRSQLNLGGVLLEICTQGSQLRTDYLSGVSCFKNMYFDGKTNAQCQRSGYEIMRSLNLTIEGASERQIFRDTMCMSTFNALACLVAETEKSCGSVTRKMMNEIFKKVELFELWMNCDIANIYALKTKFLDLHLLDKEREKIFSSFFEL